MIAFTVCGFVLEYGRYFDLSVDVVADSPQDASEKAVKKNANLVVSSVSMAMSGMLRDY